MSASLIGRFATRAAALTLLASAPVAMAQNYNFTFTSTGMNATGTITVVAGVAQLGSINVTDVPVEASPSTLLSASGSLVPDPGTPSTLTLINHDGDDIIFDNIVNLSSDPILNGNGLGFASGPYQDSVHFNTLINLWGNSPGSYTLFVAEANVDTNGNVIGDPQYVYNASTGTLTITPVPGPASISTIAVGAIALLRRRRNVH